MLETKPLYKFIEAQWQESIIPSLAEYIRIPNKSPHFDANWEENGYMEQAVTHIATWCQENGPQNMQLEVLRLSGRTPLLLMEVPGQTNETVLLYGHLDKQPEMTGWLPDLDPWQPVLKEGRLYGRGGADDGYAAYASLLAIRALQEQGLPHARCVLLIEASEESGSMDLPHYIDLIKDRLGEPSLIICLDSGAGNYEQLWMTTSLRGNIVGEVAVSTLTEGVHSGNASGIAADSFRIFRQLLSRIEDEETGEIRLPELYSQIPENRAKEADFCASVLGKQVYQELPFQPGAQPVSMDLGQLILNRTWRPALTVTGADGFPPISNAGNVLRPQSAFKLSIRVPPTVLPKIAAQAVRKALTENPPYGAKITCHMEEGSPGWNAPQLEDWLSEAAEEASQAFYQQSAAYMGEGGTIPFMGMLGEKFPKAQFLITGVLGPHSNAHGPNEFLDIPMAQKLTACVAYVLHAHSKTK